MVDVQELRRQADSRAASRPRRPFDGTVEDLHVNGLPVRQYSPSRPRRPGTVYFAHGGYGLFGTLDLQDGYCRTLAQELRRDVVAVDYRLAPEHTFRDAVDDLVSVARSATGDSSAILAGDSAGGAIAVAASKHLPQAAGLLLTNPNLDLTLATFDIAAPEGPDLALSRFAFSAWAHPRPLTQAQRLHEPGWPLPDTFIAVGARDALLPEAHHLAQHLQRHERRSALLKLLDAGHGFVAEQETARRIVAVMSTFLAD